MASLLFSEKQSKSDKQSVEDDNKHKHVNRCELFEKLSSFFPESMTQPKEDLVDMIPL